MGVGVGVSVGVEVGRIIGVILGSGVGVGCFGSGTIITIRLKTILKTTSKLTTQNMIRDPLLLELLIFSLRGNYTIFRPPLPVTPLPGFRSRSPKRMAGDGEG